MDAFVRYSGLELKPGDGGLSCNDHGLWLAGVNLLEQSPAGLAPRSSDDLDALTKAAYGRNLDAAALSRGLGAVARALNDGDTPRAMIAALYLQLPPLDTRAADRLTKTAEALTKYDPDQPRDWHGRWTADGGGGPSPPKTEAPRAAARPSAISQAAPAPTAKPSPALTESPIHDSPWGGPSRPTGGHLYQTQNVDGADGFPEPTRDFGTPAQGDNSGNFGASPGGGPGPIPNEGPPDLEPEKAPEGWDDVSGGTLVRTPRLRDGRPWPTVTHDLIQEMLSQRRVDSMLIFVPNDKIGPNLVGSTDKEEYDCPSGYSVVKLIGIPQVTRRGGVETRHAWESIDAALEMASSNRYSEIYFNRAFSTISPGELESPLRPDVVGRLRPQWRGPFNFDPYEILSGRQTLQQRQDQLLGIPGVSPVQGRALKLLKLLLSLLRKQGKL